MEIVLPKLVFVNRGKDLTLGQRRFLKTLYGPRTGHTTSEDVLEYRVIVMNNNDGADRELLFPLEVAGSRALRSLTKHCKGRSDYRGCTFQRLELFKNDMSLLVPHE